MAIPTRIYLTGFMASGKSTIGPRLAEALGYAFLDLDNAIEARVGCSIPTLFEREGEAAFRQAEAAALRETAQRECIVVALGGGALTYEDNLRWTLAHGAVVYLRVSVELLVQRLRASGTGRPLLLDDAGHPLGVAALRRRIRTMLEAREAVYEQAPITVEAEHSPPTVTQAILDALTQQAASEGDT